MHALNHVWARDKKMYCSLHDLCKNQTFVPTFRRLLPSSLKKMCGVPDVEQCSLNWMWQGSKWMLLMWLNYAGIILRIISDWKNNTVIENYARIMGKKLELKKNNRYIFWSCVCAGVWVCAWVCMCVCACVCVCQCVHVCACVKVTFTPGL